MKQNDDIKLHQLISDGSVTESAYIKVFKPFLDQAEQLAITEALQEFNSGNHDGKLVAPIARLSAIRELTQRFKQTISKGTVAAHNLETQKHVKRTNKYRNYDED